VNPTPVNGVLDGAGPVRQCLFAWGFRRVSRKIEKFMELYKSPLFRDLTGTVLEIGPGTGANLPYLAPQPLKWVGVEPNRFMRGYLQEKALALGMEVEVRDGTAENLPAPENSVDTVIGTLVLCSVTDQRRVLCEVLRVLKPGGRYLFVEHVAAAQGTMLRRIQRGMRPLWRHFADGCHPDRETQRAIESAGFHDLRIESFRAPLPVVKPHIVGVAVKAPAS
jgi:ubiquinone/menaquinone biosynthesis C-methylase UbiE